MPGYWKKMQHLASVGPSFEPSHHVICAIFLSFDPSLLSSCLNHPSFVLQYYYDRRRCALDTMPVQHWDGLEVRIVPDLSTANALEEDTTLC